jgi:hypothetical protein
VNRLLTAAMLSAEHSWSIGTFGAIAEFRRDADESVTPLADARHIGLLTARGGIRLRRDAAVVPIAFEIPSSSAPRWSTSIAFCAPAKTASLGDESEPFADLGPDGEALRSTDRGGRLFDLGVGMPHIRACIRTTDAALIALLRRHVGMPAFGRGQPAMAAILRASPTRVFISRFGRIEVMQPIPAADGQTPMGPHTHVLPKLLRSGRAFSAHTPIPAGLVPLATMHVESPFLDGRGEPRSVVDRRAAATAAMLIAAWGLPRELAFSERAARAIATASSGPPAGLARTRRQRALLKVAVAKAVAFAPTSSVGSAGAARRGKREAGETPVLPPQL